MSRIGKKPVAIPEGVSVELQKPNKIVISGPKGSLEYVYNREIKVSLQEDLKEISVEKKIHTKNSPAYWGTVSRIIQNMIHGVKDGFQKQLELNGVGYRMAVKGNSIDLALGFSHPVVVAVEDGLTAKIEGNILTIEGIDKQKVGQFAANIRSLKPVEPYKGKGFRYVGEQVIRKEGKKAGA